MANQYTFLIFFFLEIVYLKKKKNLPVEKVFCFLPDNSSRQMCLSQRIKGIFGKVVSHEI